jgi:hypothetical protein
MDGVTEKDHQGTIVFDSNRGRETHDPSRSASIELVDADTPSPSKPPHDPSERIAGVKSSVSATAASCSVWAVVVDGDNDKTDTFDEDAAGMYTVLRGHRVPKNQIYYLSPHYNLPEPCVEPTDDADQLCVVKPGCSPPGPTDFRQRTSYCNLKSVLLDHLPNQIAAGSPCEELLFFYSSHGWPGYLGCVITEDWGGKVWRGDLNEWLARVPCEKITVVIEACHSGKFVERLMSVPTLSPPAPFPSQERVIFTSTDEDGASLGDWDTAFDPNPGDVGSETIWGYIEAFGTGLADMPEPGVGRDGSISFAEAVSYALLNDASVLDPVSPNNPKVFPDPPLDFRPHSCYPLQSTVDMMMVEPEGLEDLDGVSATTVASVGAGSPHPVDLVVKNLGPSALDVATLEVFVGQNPGSGRPWLPLFPGGPAPAGGTLWWPEAFQQIGDTVLFSALPAAAERSFRLRGRLAGIAATEGDLTFVAVVDGPRDPVLMIRMPSSVFLGIDNNAVGAEVTVSPE